MPKYLPVSTYDLALNKTMAADIESICSQSPTTYYEACRPNMWVMSTVYALGATVRSPTDNNKVYECTVAGTSGGSEPAWATTANETFTDGTVTWKTHNNYSLATSSIQESEKTIADRVDGGRQITFSQILGVVSHRAGLLTHTAFLNSVDKTIEAITTATTTAPADDEILSGRTVIFHAVTISFYVD